MKIVSKSLLIVLAASSFSAFAAVKTPASQEIPGNVEQPTVDQPAILEDLTFDGARWGGKGAGYVCGAAETVFVETPAEYSALNVQWGAVVTDFTLDNGLVLATFDADEATSCRYSAILLANSSLKTIKLVESRAFASAGEGSCEDGKAFLDSALAANKYLWKESRKHLTILAPSASAEAVCGKGVAEVGIDFVFTGKIN